ncbi:hypothetical protein ACRALDRAFT_1094516 [Sodiomyces alcalophilus JCM 7366]|uniref:uncharacterized protein n=1 Tax=Sodiomyces alcalophilus JCM 7366 TaxID=591952 RepID=UPI0039B543E1
MGGGRTGHLRIFRRLCVRTTTLRFRTYFAAQQRLAYGEAMLRELLKPYLPQGKDYVRRLRVVLTRRTTTTPSP